MVVSWPAAFLPLATERDPCRMLGDVPKPTALSQLFASDLPCFSQALVLGFVSMHGLLARQTSQKQEPSPAWMRAIAMHVVKDV